MNIPEEWSYDEIIDKYYEKCNIKYSGLIPPEYNDNEDK